MNVESSLELVQVFFLQKYLNCLYTAPPFMAQKGFSGSAEVKASACNVGDLGLIPGSSAFSKSSLNIWKFSVHGMLNSGLDNFELYFASV